MRSVYQALSFPAHREPGYEAKRRQNRKQAKLGFFPLSDVGLVKGEILALRAVSQWKITVDERVEDGE